MLRTLFCCLSLVMLAACDPSRVTVGDAPALSASVCDARGANRCVFVNGPVRLKPQPVKLASRSAVFYPMAAPLDFVDGAASRWQAPEGTLTDGASIPPMFTRIVGNPTDGPFALAGAVHDAYCGIGNESGPNYHARPWQQVHRMFYDALRVGGAPERKAKLMFAAVWLGGPRWGQWDRGWQDVAISEKQAILGRAESLINAQNPPLDKLVDMLSREEEVAISASQDMVQGGGAVGGYGYGGGDPTSPGNTQGVVDPTL